MSGFASRFSLPLLMKELIEQSAEIPETSATPVVAPVTI